MGNLKKSAVPGHADQFANNIFPNIPHVDSVKHRGKKYAMTAD
jgi:hypothetical protein